MFSNKQQNLNLTNWICVEESAGRSEYLFEDAVVEEDRGGHTEREMVEDSDQGTDSQGEHYGSVDQEIEIMISLVPLISISSQINNNCLVGECWRRWQTAPVLFNLPLFLCSPVTEPNVRARVESLTEEVHDDTEDESREAASTGEISGVEFPSY